MARIHGNPTTIQHTVLKGPGVAVGGRPGHLPHHGTQRGHGAARRPASGRDLPRLAHVPVLAHVLQHAAPVVVADGNQPLDRLHRRMLARQQTRHAYMQKGGEVALWHRLCVGPGNKQVLHHPLARVHELRQQIGRVLLLEHRSHVFVKALVSDAVLTRVWAQGTPLQS